jgi:predicted dehydrogenase
MALRILVVGLGKRGCDWVREVRRHPSWELAGAVEIDPEALRQAAEDLGLAPRECFVGLDDALERLPGCDAALVATPGDLHVDSCGSAIAAGLAVLVEKPFTTSLDDAVELVAQAETAGLPLVVAQNFRYLRSQQAVRRVVGDGVLGRVGLVVGHYYRVPYDLPPSLARLSHRTLWERAVHHLDALRYVLDQEVVGVSANSFSFPWRTDPGGDSVEVLLELDGGTRAIYGSTYESSGHEYFGGGQEFYQRFVGELGTLHVVHRWLVLCMRGKLPRPLRRGPRPSTEEAILLDRFADAVRNGAVAETSGRDNLKTLAIVEACARSAEEHRWVNPQELLSDAR